MKFDAFSESRIKKTTERNICECDDDESEDQEPAHFSWKLGEISREKNTTGTDNSRGIIPKEVRERCASAIDVELIFICFCQEACQSLTLILKETVNSTTTE